MVPTFLPISCEFTENLIRNDSCALIVWYDRPYKWHQPFPFFLDYRRIKKISQFRGELPTLFLYYHYRLIFNIKVDFCGKNLDRSKVYPQIPTDIRNEVKKLENNLIFCQISMP